MFVSEKKSKMAGRLAAGLLKNHVLVGQVVTSNLQNALKVEVGNETRDILEEKFYAFSC